MTIGNMRIVFYAGNTKVEPWVEGLAAALPEADVSFWQPGTARADYAVVWTPPQQLFDEQPALKGVFNIGAGVDPFLSLALPPGAVLVRLEDAGMSVQMAEYVCHAVIRHFREFDAYDEAMARGQWAFRKPRRRSEFPIGVMGLGVLGARVAQALASFDYPVHGYSRTPKDIPGIRCYAGAEEFDDFLRATRVLVCLLPLTDETRGIMNRRNLSLMRPGGYVISVARGAHLVDDDLIALLDEGHLAGATLDVFRTEPLPPEHPFWRHPKITVTPHTSARTLRDETIAQIAGKIRAVERGEPVGGRVDRKRGY